MCFCARVRRRAGATEPDDLRLLLGGPSHFDVGVAVLSRFEGTLVMACDLEIAGLAREGESDIVVVLCWFSLAKASPMHPNYIARTVRVSEMTAVDTVLG